MNQYLVSVVIPTHNRAKYAIEAIQSILIINSPMLEIVVSDTSSSDELKERITLLDIGSYKTKLNYFNPDESLDMTGNHNAAVGAANGKYICLIGDDDTVTHELIDAAIWAEKNNIDVLSPNVVANYAWPDFRSLYFGSRHAGRLYLPPNIGPPIYVDDKVTLSIVLNNAGQGTENLPKLYHGLVKHELLEEIRSLSGNYFHGSSPDVSMATALSYLPSIRKRNFYSVNYPLTLPGASSASNTGRSAMNTHKGELDTERQTSMFTDEGWPSAIPRFFSVETVWAHSCVSTLQAFGIANHVQKFNYPRLYATLQNLHPEFSKEILEAMRAGSVAMGVAESDMRKIVLKLRVSLVFKRMAYILRRLSWPTAGGGRKFIGGLSGICEAQESLQLWLDRHGLSFCKTIND